MSWRFIRRLVLLACCLAAPAVMAADTPQSTFFRGNGLYGEAKYEEAAQQYESLLSGGSASPNLFFNLGNAYFKLGDKGRAILNYERALQLAPGDPDIEANLEFARSATKASGCTPRLWQRLAFPLAGRFSSRALGGWSVVLYSIALLALAAFRLLPQRPRALVYAAIACFCLFAVSASSLAFRLRREEGRDLAVVTSEGEAAARFEPAAGGTTHFTLKQGTRVAISDRREGWVQVQRCDGRRGWIEAQSLTRLAPNREIVASSSQ